MFKKPWSTYLPTKQKESKNVSLRFIILWDLVFWKKVYQNALLIELRNEGFQCESQYPIKVYYENSLVGKYYADIIVDGCIILELKASEAVCEEHEFQLINYLKAIGIEIELLLNFGKKPEFKRKVFTNDKKS